MTGAPSENDEYFLQGTPRAKAAHVAAREVRRQRRVVVAVEPGPAANPAVVVEQHPVQSLVVVSAHVVQDGLVL